MRWPLSLLSLSLLHWLAVAPVLAQQIAPPAAPVPASAKPEEPPPLDPASLRKAMEAHPTGPAAQALADKIRRWWSPDVLKNGMAAKTEGLDAAFAIEVEGAKAVAARSVDGQMKLALEQLPGTNVWARVYTLGDGTALRFAYDVDGRRLGAADVETYALLPDHFAQPGVPRGKLVKQTPFKSRIYAGTERDWWIYVPAQYRAGKPIAVMVFQDGGVHYVKPVPAVFDNLIHKGEMPVTAAVFLNPGVFADGRRNRAVEYDTLSDTYARFVLEEILPEVEKTVQLRKDPESRAIAGLSSGAICAFTVAWQRPEQFGRVLSWIGSYVNIGAGESKREGGHNYPPLIRKLKRLPIRIWLQDGANDLEQEAGSWTLANHEMERSLTYAAWDFRMVRGNGFHSPKQGIALLPEALRWLFRDHRTPAAAPIVRALVPGR